MAKSAEQFNVSILECADGTMYTDLSRGSLARCVAAHNAGDGAPYTKGRLPVRLLGAFPAGNRRWPAIALCWAIRQLSKRGKQKLLAGDAALLRQLSEKAARMGRELEEYHEANKRIEADQ